MSLYVLHFYLSYEREKSTLVDLYTWLHYTSLLFNNQPHRALVKLFFWVTLLKGLHLIQLSNFSALFIQLTFTLDTHVSFSFDHEKWTKMFKHDICINTYYLYTGACASRPMAYHRTGRNRKLMGILPAYNHSHSLSFVPLSYERWALFQQAGWHMDGNKACYPGKWNVPPCFQLIKIVPWSCWLKGRTNRNAAHCCAKRWIELRSKYVSISTSSIKQYERMNLKNHKIYPYSNEQNHYQTLNVLFFL